MNHRRDGQFLDLLCEDTGSFDPFRTTKVESEVGKCTILTGRLPLRTP
jgi:hypothetical protein